MSWQTKLSFDTIHYSNLQMTTNSQGKQYCLGGKGVSTEVTKKIEYQEFHYNIAFGSSVVLFTVPSQHMEFECRFQVVE